MIWGNYHENYNSKNLDNANGTFVPLNDFPALKMQKYYFFILLAICYKVITTHVIILLFDSFINNIDLIRLLNLFIQKNIFVIQV